MEELDDFLYGFKRSLLKTGFRHKGGYRSAIIEGLLYVMAYGITSKEDDIRMSKDFHVTGSMNVNRVFNRKLFVTKHSAHRKKYAMNRFLADSEYRNSFANGKPREARAVSAKEIIEFEDHRARDRSNKKRKRKP